jgi:hypothetical protein
LTFLAMRISWGMAHWINGNDGKVIPFGTKDNGGDLVETSFLARDCWPLVFKNGTTTEQAIATKADAFGKAWNGIGIPRRKCLYWHWSPNYGWEMNFKLEGYNEFLT